MIDSETKRKLEKLKKIEQGNRDRAKRFLEKVRDEGKKQISAIISGDTYEEITRRKDAAQPPLTTGQVIDQAIMGFVDTTVNINESKQPKSPQYDDLPDILEGIDPDNLTIEDRDKLIFKLFEAYPEKSQAKDRIRVLNDSGVLFNGKPWTIKRFTDQLNLARRRAKK